MDTHVTPPAAVQDLNWSPEQAEQFGNEIVAIWRELLQRLPNLPVARNDRRESVAAALGLPIPREPMSADALRDVLRELTFRQSMYPGHSGFMAYVSGAGTVPGAAADLLAAALNQNCGGWRLAPGATEIEIALLRWFAERFGLGDEAGGILTSGGAMANFVALKVARDIAGGPGIRDAGLRGLPPMSIYASSESHVVIDRAADMLGLGQQAVRHIPVDKDQRMRLDALAAAIQDDLRAAVRPVAVVATAGTTGTGAIDPLPGIADLCEQHGIWLHIDGAYGAVASLVPQLKPLFAGLERADSIAFDPHKWLYTPLSGGAVLMKRFVGLSDSFSVSPSYVHEDKDLTGRGLDFHTLGPQFSRGFTALKVWVSLLAHGTDAITRRIAHDVELARYLAARAQAMPRFEVMAETVLSIACFRFVPDGLPDGEESERYLNDLNARVMAELQLHGRVYPSNADIGGRFALRACIVNFRTEHDDIDALLELADELGSKLDAQLRPSALKNSRLR